jgi:hypothetical protein
MHQAPVDVRRLLLHFSEGSLSPAPQESRPSDATFKHNNRWRANNLQTQPAFKQQGWRTNHKAMRFNTTHEPSNTVALLPRSGQLFPPTPFWPPLSVVRAITCSVA